MFFHVEILIEKNIMPLQVIVIYLTNVSIPLLKFNYLGVSASKREHFQLRFPHINIPPESGYLLRISPHCGSTVHRKRLARKGGRKTVVLARCDVNVKCHQGRVTPTISFACFDSISAQQKHFEYGVQHMGGLSSG